MILVRYAIVRFDARVLETRTPSWIPGRCLLVGLSQRETVRWIAIDRTLSSVKTPSSESTALFVGGSPKFGLGHLSAVSSLVRRVSRAWQGRGSAAAGNARGRSRPAASSPVLPTRCPRRELPLTSLPRGTFSPTSLSHAKHEAHFGPTSCRSAQARGIHLPWAQYARRVSQGIHDPCLRPRRGASLRIRRVGDEGRGVGGRQAVDTLRW